MKRNANTIIKTLLLPFCVLLVFTACNKHEAPLNKSENPLAAKGTQRNTSEIFKARLISSFCAYNIVQIVDSAFYNYGMNWTDSQGKTYQHVFAVKNYCDFGTANLKVNETFKCEIVEKAKVEDCIVCLGFMETPPLQYNIIVGR